jgi:hypothetical protein
MGDATLTETLPGETVVYQGRQPTKRGSDTCAGPPPRFASKPRSRTRPKRTGYTRLSGRCSMTTSVTSGREGRRSRVRSRSERADFLLPNFVKIRNEGLGSSGMGREDLPRH